MTEVGSARSSLSRHSCCLHRPRRRRGTARGRAALAAARRARWTRGVQRRPPARRSTRSCEHRAALGSGLVRGRALAALRARAAHCGRRACPPMPGRGEAAPPPPPETGRKPSRLDPFSEAMPACGPGTRAGRCARRWESGQSSRGASPRPPGAAAANRRAPMPSSTAVTACYGLRVLIWVGVAGFMRRGQTGAFAPLSAHRSWPQPIPHPKGHRLPLRRQLRLDSTPGTRLQSWTPSSR